MSTSRTTVVIAGDSNPLRAELRRAAGDLRGFAGELSATSLASSALGKIGGIATIGAGLVAGAKAAIDYGAGMQDLADQTGLTATQAEKLSTAFAGIGLDDSAFVQPVNKMGLAIDQAVAGNETLRASFADLGLDVNDLDLKAPGEQLKALMAAIDPSKPEQMAAAVAILGKSAPKAMAALKEVGDEMGDTNLKFDAAAAKADAFGDSVEVAFRKAKVAALSGMDFMTRGGEHFAKLLHFGDVVDLDQANAQIENNSKYLVQLAASSKEAQAAEKERLQQVRKDDIANDGKLAALMKEGDMFPRLIDLAEELALAQESGSDAVARRAKEYEKEIYALQDVYTKITELNKKLLEPGSDLKKGAEKLNTLTAERIAITKRLDEITKANVKTELDKRKEAADAAKDAAKDQLDAQKELNNLIDQEADKRRAAVDAALSAAKAYNRKTETPEQTKARVAASKDALATANLAQTYDAQGRSTGPDVAAVAAALTDALENRDEMTTGNAWSDRSTDRIFETAQSILASSKTQSDATAALAASNARTDLTNRAGGVQVQPALSVLPAGIPTPAAAAVSATTWQGSMLSETIRIRTAVENLGGPPLKF